MTTLKARILQAIEDDDRFALRQIHDEHDDSQIRHIIRQADNLVIAFIRGDKALEDMCARELVASLPELDERERCADLL